MAWLNSPAGYGGLTKFYHWLVVALFACQYVAAAIMLGMAENATVLGLAQSVYYNWHKSLGLVALVVAVLRLVNRRLGALPPWAPTLTTGEQAFIHRAEQVLYASMLAMPVSGFVYVMAGGYGVEMFGRFALPNPIGDRPTLASVAKWVHIVGAWVLLAAIAGHAGLVLRHQFVLKDGLVSRMLPGRRR